MQEEPWLLLDTSSLGRCLAHAPAYVTQRA